MKVYTVTEITRNSETGECSAETSSVHFSLTDARKAIAENMENVKKMKEATGGICLTAECGKNNLCLTCGSFSREWEVHENYVLGNMTGEQLASLCSEFVNTFSVKKKEFAEAMCREHRTLQQSFMRLVCHYIREMANNSYDDRNEASVMLAKKFVKVIEESDDLPFI